MIKNRRGDRSEEREDLQCPKDAGERKGRGESARREKKRRRKEKRERRAKKAGKNGGREVEEGKRFGAAG